MFENEYGKRCFTMTTLCLVERVIPASADPGRNTSLHDVRTFSVAFAARTRPALLVTSTFLLVSPFCEPHVRIIRMSILRSCRRDVLCHDANVAMRRIRLINERARCHTRQSRLCVVCVLTNELAGKFAKTYIYLITTISLLGTFA